MAEGIRVFLSILGRYPQETPLLVRHQDLLEMVAVQVAVGDIPGLIRIGLGGVFSQYDVAVRSTREPHFPNGVGDREILPVLKADKRSTPYRGVAW